MKFVIERAQTMRIRRLIDRVGDCPGPQRIVEREQAAWA
jgi:hypothetical protein